jgi:hypothetical protein
MLENDVYCTKIDDSIKEMKMQVLRAREEASVCMQARFVELDKKSDSRATGTNHVRCASLK